MDRLNLLILQRTVLLICFALGATIFSYGQDAKTQELKRLRSTPSIDQATQQVLRNSMLGNASSYALERQNLRKATLKAPRPGIRRVSIPMDSQVKLLPRKLELPAGSLNLARESVQYRKEQLTPIHQQQRIIRAKVN